MLASEPYRSFLEHRSRGLAAVVESELYRLQFPSLAKRVRRDADIGEIRRAVRSIDVESPDDATRAACSQVDALHCTVGKSCGFGCQAHHLVFCMVMAYGTNRTLVLNTDGWSYARRGGWQGKEAPSHPRFAAAADAGLGLRARAPRSALSAGRRVCQNPAAKQRRPVAPRLHCQVSEPRGELRVSVTR